MNKLQQVEQLRQKLVTELLEVTGLAIGDIQVEVSLNNQDNNSPLAVEARDLKWYPDRHGENAWYTSEKPSGGATTLFAE